MRTLLEYENMVLGSFTNNYPNIRDYLDWLNMKMKERADKRRRAENAPTTYLN